MVLKVYIDMLSEPCRSLVIFLKQTDIPHEVVTVCLLENEHKKPEFKNLFPLGLVPAIQDGDFCLAESVAIFRYLTTRYPDQVPDFLYPKELEKRARVDEYLAWHHTGTRKGRGIVFENEVLLPLFKLPLPSEQQMKKDLETMEKMLDQLENIFLKGNEYLTGNEVTIADVMATSELVQSIATGRDLTEGRPRLAAFVERVRERLNPVFDEVHEPVFAWGKTLSKT